MVKLATFFSGNAISLYTYNFKIRIAIHTGPVSAGLVGEAKFRYCVFGEGFDVPKRLLEMDGVQDQIIVTNATKQYEYSVSKSSTPYLF